MMRPLLGQGIVSSHVNETIAPVKSAWGISPNPAQDELTFYFPGDEVARYRLSNVQGQAVMEGNVASNNTISITTLPAGMYFVNITINGVTVAPQKLIKL
jgi:hypothetical protein